MAPGKRKTDLKEDEEIDQPSSSAPSKRAKKETVRYSQESTNEKNASSRHNVARNKIKIYEERMPVPTRDAKGFLVFADHKEFRPNLTPKEVLQMGSFGGTYFRSISSSVTKETYQDAWKEFPADWFDKLDVRTQIASQTYRDSLNTYKVGCGGDLKMWEESGWITEADPYGWFQWYCRFYLGRRCSDDERQISRALGVMGPTGRWRRNLINKILQQAPVERAVENCKISPKVRQLLQHWGYKVSLEDVKSFAKK